MFVRSVNLSEMCLNVIIHNLESIIFNDKIPEKNTNFLLRMYAEKVFKEYRKMKGKTKEKEKVMLWFLNPHVKSVTISGRLCTEKVINRLQIVGSMITSLNLHRSAASESELSAVISCVPCVRILDLSDTSCTDETLSVIQKTCPGIESLNLRKCEQITDEGMKNLCGENQSLKIVNLLYSSIRDSGVCTVLRGMPLLECVKYGELPDLLVKMSNDPKKYDLTELIFYYRTNADPLKVIQTWIRLCPKIKRVHFKHKVQEEVLQACTGFQELEELRIKGSCIYNFDVRLGCMLAPMVPIALNLKTLILTCLEMDTLMLVEEFRNLEKLYMKNVSFTSFDPKDVTCTENKLDVLVIKDAETVQEVPDPTYEAIILLISLSKNVTKFFLGYSEKLQSALLQKISYSMKNLSTVYFRCIDLELHSLNPFFDIPSLTEIHVETLGTLVSGTLMGYSIHDFAKSKSSPKSSSTLFWRSVYANDSEEDSYSTDDSMSDDLMSDDGCDSHISEYQDDHYGTVQFYA